MQNHITQNQDHNLQFWAWGLYVCCRCGRSVREDTIEIAKQLTKHEVCYPK